MSSLANSTNDIACPRMSVIIANYNYARFVGAAIESALAVDWADVEVIVIDDGSTDDSEQILRAYADKVQIIRQPNSGQRVANNAAFAASSGERVIFLDADDLLAPSLAREVDAVWQPGTTKVQVQMAKVDAQGKPLGVAFPRFHKSPRPGDIRGWARSSTEYPSPPGSGNVYARSFLQAIFPLGEDRDSSTDSSCIAMAPFHGDVLTIAKPLVFYRIHGDNNSNLLRDDANYTREIKRAIARLHAAQDASRMFDQASPRPGALFRGKHLLQLRVASMRLRPADHPLDGDSLARALWDAMMTPFRPDFESLGRSLLIAGWTALAVCLPRAWARGFIRQRFSASNTGLLGFIVHLTAARFARSAFARSDASHPTADRPASAA